MIWGLLVLLWNFPLTARAQTSVNAATCNSTDVQTAINSATEGGTVVIPAGTCTWTSGVTISGKGIVVQGAGAGRVIGVSVTSSAVPIGTGTKTFSGVIAATVQGVLSNAQPSLSAGQNLIIYENGFLGNSMSGTVTSLSGGTLTMNITSATGACGATAPANTMQSNCKRWLITTPPSTKLINNLTSAQVIKITEDTSFHTTVTGIQFAQGTGAASAVYIARNNPGGVAVLIHDNFFESNNGDIIDTNSNRGVISNNSFVFSPFNVGQWVSIRIKDSNNTVLSSSWSTPSTMGTADTTGQNNLYFETNDVHAGSTTDLDDNARAVIRYNFLNVAGGLTHGADSSFIGMRHFEFYNNAGIFQAYTDGTTPNMFTWMYVRAGTFAWHDNTLPVISSQDWGSKADINMTVMSLQRLDTYPCWGAGFSTPGQYYPAVRQVGFGRVTGTGTVTYPSDGYTKASTSTNAGYVGAVYVGDSEPAYIWNNSRTVIVGLSDYGLGNGATSCPTSPTPDSTSSYIVSGRDYFNGTAKPGYTPYAYPHPLTLGSGTGAKPAPPTGLAAIVN